MITES